MDINEILIEQIKQNDCLFNLSHREYKNVHKKMEIWESVAQSLNLSADACRKRWKGLRDTYKKRKRSELLASGSGAPNPVKRWKYMEMLSFLDNYTDSRP
ncbi:PREDICTED: transcription factor Adf-1-like [Rhagoletis zephyria]|nr:PREDICTED: transcription factor Adf-1-like [Rhagoletis zephyria]